MNKPQGTGQVDVADLVTPIYIDTNALLDVLASLDNGFTFVEKVTSQLGRSRETSAQGQISAGTEFGIPNVLNLFKINLGGSLDSKGTSGSTEERQSERYHTYGSLLYRLRRSLSDNGLIKRLDDTDAAWEQLKSMDFVELHGILNPNPFTDALKVLDRLAGMFEIYSTVQGRLSGATTQTTSKHGRQPNPPSRVDQAAVDQVKAVRKLVQGLIEDVEKSDVRTVVADLLPSRHSRAVSALFTEYLRDPSMTELARKEYRVFGRVVGKVSSSSETIDLLAGTGLSGLPEDSITQLTELLKLGALPKPETRISGPAVQVLPIAIYV